MATWFRESGVLAFQASFSELIKGYRQPVMFRMHIKGWGKSRSLTLTNSSLTLVSKTTDVHDLLRLTRL
jgi:hypothetical protein